MSQTEVQLIKNNAVVEADIANDAVTRDKINVVSTSSAPGIEIKGDDGSQEGYLQLNCRVNSHGVKIQSPPHSASQSYKIILPDNQIAADKILKVKSITGSGSTATGQLEFADDSGGKLLQTVNATTSSQVENATGSYYDTNLSANITLTAANKVLIFVAQSLEARQYNATGFSVGRLILTRTTSGSATDIFSGGRSVVTSGPGSGSYFVASGCIASIVAEDSPGVGTHNYKTRIARIVGGGGTAVRANSDGHPAEIILMEIKA